MFFDANFHFSQNAAKFINAANITFDAFRAFNRMCVGQKLRQVYRGARELRNRIAGIFNFAAVNNVFKKPMSDLPRQELLAL